MLSDVIAALATPPGQSALAVLRLSGSGAFDVAGAVLSPFEPEPARTARVSRAAHPDNGEVLDELVYVPFRGPHSYTGEDMVEISTHGGVLVPSEVFAALLAAGAREALPGEFTRRALLNGKLDLIQAEAIGDLVAATTPVQRRAALGQIERNLSSQIAGLRESVLQLESLCCYEIDFPEEDSGPVPPEKIDVFIETIIESLAELLETADDGERLRNGALCVIAGRPNVGKSTLFNALLGKDRAIVTPQPGTTRDAIEASVSIGGYPFRLVDTAGLRSTSDVVEGLGVEVSRRYLDEADIVLFCVEATAESSEVEAITTDRAAPLLVARTMSDLVSARELPPEEPGVVHVSAVTGEGLGGLRDELVGSMFSALYGSRSDQPIVTRARQRVALEKAIAEMGDFKTARASGIETVVAATHLRAAVTVLETIVGAVSPEDVLERVFSDFCVGK